MPSKSSTSTDEKANTATATAVSRVVRDARSRSAAKGVATVARRKEERRADSLAVMREQIADGSLVIRQMTPAERTAAPPSRAPGAPASRNRS